MGPWQLTAPCHLLACLLQVKTKSIQASKRLRGPNGRFLSTEEIEQTFSIDNLGSEIGNIDNEQVGALPSLSHSLNSNLKPLGQVVEQPSSSTATEDTLPIDELVTRILGDDDVPWELGKADLGAPDGHYRLQAGI